MNDTDGVIVKMQIHCVLGCVTGTLGIINP